MSFGADNSSVTIQYKKLSLAFDLQHVDSLYSIAAIPICINDDRFRSSRCIDVTLEEDLQLSHSDPTGVTTAFAGTAMKSPSRLGTWTAKILWKGKSYTLSSVTKAFGEELTDFCEKYIAPLSIPKARKTYQINDVDDMADLSISFFGIGTDRLQKTLERSIGLSPMIKDGKKMRHRVPVPVHSFPQGRWKAGKTPRVSKGIIQDIHRASIGEVLFMDTFEVDDSGFRYAQVFVDYRSKFGEVIPMKSRTQVGWAFSEFCARHFTPLILIRNNIGENKGGDIMTECLARSVRSAYICPYKKEQNYAEGYIGRITALASYGMVYSGAPMFMWRWCTACAVFVNNITATYYSREDTWATPYEIICNAPFPDSSIVVPFGCGVLVLLKDDEQGKFKSRCALMIFAHYANQHPLYTYAVYSPRTKKILYRQDCIFLTNLFPMRSARSKAGHEMDGDIIVPYRSPASIRQGDVALSFCEWNENDPLPDFMTM